MTTRPMLRVLRSEDHEDFQRLRSDALVRHPHAYSASSGEDAAPDEVVARARLASTQDQFIVGAFRLGAMVGMLGLVRMRPRKLCHRANLWGAYVVPDLRGQGLAKSLLRLVLAEALRQPGLEQVTASVYSDSAAARQLFQGAGFKRWGVSRQAAKVEGAYLDEDHYTLPLTRNFRDEVSSFEHAPTSDIWRGD
jgi:RimJ/RimL family protein N-acetyltransferase